MTDPGSAGLARLFWVAALGFALLAGLGIAGLDAIVARWVAGPPTGPTIWNQLIGFMDLVVLKEVSNFLLGALLVLAAGLLMGLRSSRRAGWPLLYLGLVQFLATTIADLAKPQLGRLRPWEAADAGGVDTWFVGANSFPSGHTAFYAGLFFPLIMLFPRWTALWVAPPLFVAVSRVIVHDHYLSDVAASLALATALGAALAPLARRGQGRTSVVA